MRAQKSGILVSRTFRINKIEAAIEKQMWGIFNRYYDSVDIETFKKDMAAKTSVIVLFDSGDNSVQGFSTIEVRYERIQGKKVCVIYSGDTVIESSYWGQTALHNAFLKYLITTKLKNIHLPVYWFLISKGYKTYLLLSRNFKNYWPNHQTQNFPEFERNLLNRLGTAKFKDSWVPEEGVIRFSYDTCKLKEAVAPITEKHLSHQDIAYFVEKNPEHATGTELACLGKLDMGLIYVRVAKQLKNWRVSMTIKSEVRPSKVAQHS